MRLILLQIVNIKSHFISWELVSMANPHLEIFLCIIEWETEKENIEFLCRDADFLVWLLRFVFTIEFYCLIYNPETNIAPCNKTGKGLGVERRLIESWNALSENFTDIKERSQMSCWWSQPRLSGALYLSKSLLAEYIYFHWSNDRKNIWQRINIISTTRVFGHQERLIRLN